MREQVLAAVVAAATFAVVTGGIVGVGLAVEDPIRPVNFASVTQVRGATVRTPSAPGAQRAALAALPTGVADY